MPPTSRRLPPPRRLGFQECKVPFPQDPPELLLGIHRLPSSPHTGFEEGTGAGTGPTGNLQLQCSLLPISGISPSKQSSFLDFKSPRLLRVPKVRFGTEGCTASFARRHGSYSWGPTHLTDLLVSKIFKSSS